MRTADAVGERCAPTSPIARVVGLRSAWCMRSSGISKSGHWLALIVVLAVTAGCSSGSSADPTRTSASSTPGTSNSASTTASSSQSADAPLELDDAANGSTVQVRVGSRITVTLASTYWAFDPPVAPVLQQAAAPTSSASPHCLPGAGCGVVVASFRIIHAGTAMIHASRTTCGEALKCGPAQSTYRVVVIAAP